MQYPSLFYLEVNMTPIQTLEIRAGEIRQEAVSAIGGMPELDRRNVRSRTGRR